MSIFIGVDSGGTRTNVHIVSSDGEVNAQYEVGESLSGAVAPELYPRVLRKILVGSESIISRNAAADTPVYMFISAAGFSAWSKEVFVSTLHEVCPQQLGGRIVAAGAANDAVSMLLGMRANAVVIAGTGSNIVLSVGTEFVQIGGHNWVACDEGSGFWIGLRAIRRAFRDLESGVESTLLARLYDAYGIRHGDSEQLIKKAYDLSVNDKSTKREIARFAASVCGAAERGDVASQDIVKQEAEELADLMAVGLRRYFTDAQLEAGLPIVQGGSVLANNFYRSSFENQIEMRLRSGQPVSIDWKSDTTGLSAAVRLAKDLADGSPPGMQSAVSFRPVVVRF